MKQWEKYIQKTKGEKESIPSYDKVLVSSELVLDNQGQLQEINRLAGENSVSTINVWEKEEGIQVTYRITGNIGGCFNLANWRFW